MIDWSVGGRFTGSLLGLVDREVKQHLSRNPVARRLRYRLPLRMLRRMLSSDSYTPYVIIYLSLNLLLIAGEALATLYAPQLMPGWASPGGEPPSTDVKELILDVSSYLLGAQVALLGVISLALALVTLIAQSEGSSTDVQVYYKESLAFELVASCVALLAVMCVQLVWPMQFALHRLGLGTDNQLFKLTLLSVHLLWLLINVIAVGYFIGLTFRFVQQSARERIRERYVSNLVYPSDLAKRLRNHFLAVAGSMLPNASMHAHPSVFFGRVLSGNQSEITSTFERPTELRDVRMLWVQWVVRRWSTRSMQARPASGAPLGAPHLVFTPTWGDVLEGKVNWCQRKGGVPLTPFERFVLRRAFCFRGSPSD